MTDEKDRSQVDNCWSCFMGHWVYYNILSLYTLKFHNKKINKELAIIPRANNIPSLCRKVSGWSFLYNSDGTHVSPHHLAVLHNDPS